jgi:hypothetical protein
VGTPVFPFLLFRLHETTLANASCRPAQRLLKK